MRFFERFTTVTKVLIAGAALASVLTACKRGSDDQDIQASGLAMIHASPDAQALDFVVDNTRANQKDFKLDSAIQYLAAYPGNRRLGVTAKGSSTFLTQNYYNLTPGKFYSAFVIGKAASLDLLVMEDKLVAPASGKARVRFLNLSPDAAALDLTINGREGKLATARAFKEYTEFADIEPGEGLTLVVTESANPQVTASRTTVSLSAGKVYTIWARGLKSATDNTRLGIGVMLNSNQ
ncbi:hypothetical protein C7T94_16465 [Pedobacter yulinensis]|uniref:DUF4397 domain-containing protein n=1 Tax=Pedobacter yulinensis TaxID=2126353 RepID=A0A2T3HIW0_9SPHI|nr:DUF4397 domain-containing protein [Pedobacter yulinensis]PST82370.1 hypothetical protein C7T94_16465 [Pedobacter yulinensis]